MAARARKIGGFRKTGPVMEMAGSFFASDAGFRFAQRNLRKRLGRKKKGRLRRDGNERVRLGRSDVDRNCR
jgi:hypothetical protein